jgi:bile acid-coenzyme A ligase
MLLFASSGSTGIPKIINPFGPGCFKPGQFLGGLGKVVRRDSRRKTFTCTPLNHGAGSAGMYLGLFDGSEMTSIARFDPDVALWAIKEFGVHSVGLVPTMMARMMRSSRFDAEHIASLQTVSHTGGICSPAVKRAWIDLVGPERIVEIYGSAESVGHTVITGTEWLEHPGSQGKPVNCELSILDEDGKPVPTGTVGEVFVKPLASEVDLDHKYLSDTLRMRQRGDLVSVGDLGYVDDDGYLYVVGRADDLIITGGVNVYPDEVEDVLRAVPGVVDCVVVPVPDEERGQSVHAVVALGPGIELSADQLLDAMRSRISSYKLPRTIEIVPEIDRSEAGKVRRKKYAAAAAARVAAGGTPS